MKHNFASRFYIQRHQRVRNSINPAIYMAVLWNGFGIHNYGHGSDNLIIMSNFISDGKQLTLLTQMIT